jgi:hypothetical protein
VHADTPSLPQPKNFPQSHSSVSTKQSVMAKVLARNPSASSRLRTQTNPNDSNDYDTVDLMRSKLRGQPSATPGDSQSSERIMNYYLKQADERGIPQRLPFTDESRTDEERLLQVIESNLGDVSLHVQEEYQGKLEESRGHQLEESPDGYQEGYASFDPRTRNNFLPRRDEMPTRHLAPMMNHQHHNDYTVRIDGSQNFSQGMKQSIDKSESQYRPRLADSRDFEHQSRAVGVTNQELAGSRNQVPGMSSADKRIGAAGYTPSNYPGPSRMSQASLQPPGEEGYSYMHGDQQSQFQMDRAARQESARANFLGVEDAEEENRSLQQQPKGMNFSGGYTFQNLLGFTGGASRSQIQEQNQDDHQSIDDEQLGKFEGPKHFELRMLEMYHEWYQEDFERSVVSKQEDTFDPVYHLLSHVRSQVPKNRVGALTQIYKLIYTSALEDLDRIKDIIIELGNLVLSRRNCVYSLCLALEMLYFVGPVFSWMKQPNFINALGELAAYFECEEVQRKTIRILFGLGTEGIKELLRICSLSPEVSACFTPA